YFIDQPPLSRKITNLQSTKILTEIGFIIKSILVPEKQPGVLFIQQERAIKTTVSVYHSFLSNLR
ncbi:MAG: hypothetical protein DRP62_04835, partial [Planctomycetota bacterium]